jgi:hypothetical protein
MAMRWVVQVSILLDECSMQQRDQLLRPSSKVICFGSLIFEFSFSDRLYLIRVTTGCIKMLDELVEQFIHLNNCMELFRLPIIIYKSAPCLFLI